MSELLIVSDTDMLEKLLEVPVEVEAQPLPQPQLPSALEQELHALTHSPFASWCPHCVAGKSREDRHFRKTADEKISATRNVYGGICDNALMDIPVDGLGWCFMERTLLATWHHVFGLSPQSDL